MFVASRFYAYWFKRLSSPTLLHGPTSLVTKPRSPGFKNKSKVRNHVLQRDSKRWTHFVTVYGASTHARQLVAVFQVLYSLCGLNCVGYAQKSLEFVSRSPLIHVVGRSFCLYTDSPICSNWWFQRQMLFYRLEVECWNEDETHAVQQSPTQF